MKDPLLTAALIVRDEEAMLDGCLASLEGVADEVVLVDTGSTDATCEIAHARGARVLHQPWADSFSTPRNLGLEHARGRWILYIDADERLRPIPREQLVARLADAREVALRILLAPFLDATPYFEYRLWRNDPRIRFHGVMHEQVVNAIHRVAAADRRRIADWPEVALDHLGYEGDQGRKHRRNLPLLEEQLAREPHNIFNWRHLARVRRGLGDATAAERALERAVALARREQPPSREGSLAWADLVRLRHERGDDIRALLDEARARWPEQWLLVWIEGQVELEGGRPDRAVAHFRRLLEVDLDTLPQAGLAYDRRMFGEFALASLGLALFRDGRLADAADAYARAEHLNPTQADYRVKRLLAQGLATGRSNTAAWRSTRLSARCRQARGSWRERFHRYGSRASSDRSSGGCLACGFPLP